MPYSRNISGLTKKYADPWLNAPANQTVVFPNVSPAEGYARTNAEQPTVPQQPQEQRRGLFDFGKQAASQNMGMPQSQQAQSADYANPMQNQQAVQLYQQALQNIKAKRGY